MKARIVYLFFNKPAKRVRNEDRVIEDMRATNRFRLKAQFGLGVSSIAVFLQAQREADVTAAGHCL